MPLNHKRIMGTWRATSQLPFIMYTYHASTPYQNTNYREHKNYEHQLP